MHHSSTTPVQADPDDVEDIDTMMNKKIEISKNYIHRFIMHTRVGSRQRGSTKAATSSKRCAANHFAHASGANAMRCFEKKLVVAPRPSAYFAAEAYNN